MTEMTYTASAGADQKIPSAARRIIALLEHIEVGHLTIRLPDGGEVYCGTDGGPSATLVVRDYAVFERVLVRGDVGFGEAYIDEHWDSPDVTALLSLLVRNRNIINSAVYGNWLSLLSARLKHRFNANSKPGSQRNIMSHYDLGNDFYACWLDASMSYSAALYGNSSSNDLSDAQLQKYHRILNRLDVRPGQTVLEIGCGWGGFAEVAARDYGVELIGVTLSPAQLEFAQQRMKNAGLEDQVELRLQDYRDISGKFDHIVSIEMFEAVGETYWAGYFEKLHELLKPGGRAVVQTITIDESLFEKYRKGTDFIQQYIFPGGMLPSKSRFIRGAWGKQLMVRDAFCFGKDYGRTLSQWRQRFEQAWPTISALGFDEKFRRLWRFYLAYCEAGFMRDQTDVVQFELERAS